MQVGFAVPAKKNLEAKFSLPIIYNVADEKKTAYIRLLILDFSKIGDFQILSPTSINPDGTIASSRFAWKLKKVLDHLYKEKNKLETSKIRIRFHLLVFSDTPEYRNLVVAISILSSENAYIGDIISSFNSVCTYYVQPKRLMQILFLVDRLDKFQFPQFSLKIDQIPKFVPKQCIRRISIFDLTSLFETLPSRSPLQPNMDFSLTDGVRLCKDPFGEDIIIPQSKKIFLCSEQNDLHKVLIESPILPSNHIILSQKVDFFKQYMYSNPDIAEQRKMKVISSQKNGINLFKIMKQDPLFAIRVFRSWMLLVDPHPSLFDTAFNLVESLQNKPFDDVNSFNELLKHKFYILNEISIVESYLDQFLLSFEEILSLPFFSHENDSGFKEGGLIVLDCSSIGNPFHVLAIGFVLHQLRVSGYHNYSLSIPGWDNLKTNIFAIRNLKAYFGILQFNNYFTVFSSRTYFSPIVDLCELIIEDEESFTTNKQTQNVVSYCSPGDIVCTVKGSNSFVYGSSVIDSINVMKQQACWDLSAERDKEPEMDEIDEEDFEIDNERYLDFEEQHFKWILCYELWRSSPQSFQDLKDVLTDLPVSSKTLDDLLEELVADQIILRQNPDMYSLSLDMRSKMSEIGKNNFKMSPLVENVVYKKENEHEILNFLKKQVMAIQSVNDIFNSAIDIYLICKSSPRLEKYGGIFYSFIFEISANGTKVDNKTRDILKQMLLESIENIANIISDEDYTAVKTLSDKNPDFEATNQMDLDEIELSKFPKMSIEIKESMVSSHKNNFDNCSTKENNVPNPYMPINLDLNTYKVKDDIQEQGFSELLETAIEIPLFKIEKLVIPKLQTKNEKDLIVEMKKVFPPIPKPIRGKIESSSSRVPVIPLSALNRPIGKQMDLANDSLDLAISEEFLINIDLQFKSVEHQPLDQIMIRLFNECLIYPVTEKRFYRPLLEIIEILSKVSKECNVSIQEFTNELAQNLMYWEKYQNKEQRDELKNQILAKFKSALKNFRYSPHFREKLLEKIIGFS